MDKEVKYNPSFESYFKSEHRYAILWGGAGSGKSFSAAQKIIGRVTSNIKHRYLVVRKVKNTLKESVFKLLKSQIYDYGLDPYVRINNTEMSFTFQNGNEIITTGLDDPEKLKSIHNITGVWIEEATELEEEDFDQIDLRLRGETEEYKQITLSFNPISQDHWIRQRFFETDTELKDKYKEMVFAMNSNFKDNLFLDEQYKRVLQEQFNHDANMRRIYVEGKWGKERIGSEFYAQFDYDKHIVPVAYIPGKSIHLSFDFNSNPYMPLSLWQIDKVDGRYQCRNFDEITLENPYNKTEDVCREFAKRYPDSAVGVFIYGDAMGRARQPNSRFHNYEIIERELRDYLRNWSDRVPRKNHPLDRRREFINKILSGGMDIDILIDPGCEKMIADMENVMEDKDGGKFKAKAKNKAGVAYEKYGHLSDCLDYFFCNAFESHYEDYFGTRY